MDQTINANQNREAPAHVQEEHAANSAEIILPAPNNATPDIPEECPGRDQRTDAGYH